MEAGARDITVDFGAADAQAEQVLQEAAANKKVKDPLAEQKKLYREMRWFLMVIATVVAWTAYRAGLNPPGGFWRDDGHHHRAGDPVMRDKDWARYVIFYCFDAMAFYTSLLIILLLLSERSYHDNGKVVALMLATYIAGASYVITFIAGTTFYGSSWFLNVAFTCFSFAGIIYIGAGCRRAWKGLGF